MTDRYKATQRWLQQVRDNTTTVLSTISTALEYDACDVYRPAIEAHLAKIRNALDYADKTLD